MATANERYPSTFLSSADVADGDLPVTITAVTTELVGPRQEEKTVVHFQEEDRGLVLNKTNWFAIANALGKPDDAYWTGGKVTLVHEMVQYSGKMVPSIRIRPAVQQAAAVQSADLPVADADIPF